MVRLSAIQLNSKPNVADNLNTIKKQLTLLTKDVHVEQHIVVLPECCLFFGASDKEQFQLAQNNVLNDSLYINKLQRQLAQLATQFNVYLVAGSIPILTPQQDKFFNQCCVFTPQGKLVSSYDKIHLFDVDVQDNAKNYCESRYTQAGKQLSIVNTSLVTLGLTICFDVRFPVLFQKLKSLGADIITVPSAFTRVTGKAHWQTLLQARAIENQVYIIAAGQEGVHENGRETWGHSMIISPWGEILESLEQGEGFISVSFEPEEMKRIRAAMPLNSPLD